MGSPENTPYEGTERRTDPERNALSPDQYAAATAFSRYSDENGKAIRPQDLDTERFTEGDEMRAEVQKIFDRLEHIRILEAQALLDTLMSQCESAAKVWTEKYEIKNAPTTQQLVVAAEKWLQALDPAVLQGFVEVCPKAELVVIPGGVTVAELAKLTGRIGIDNEKVWSEVSRPSWGFGIAGIGEEGDMPFDASILYVNPEALEENRKRRTNEKMVAEYSRRFEAKGLELMPQYGYVSTGLAQLAQGQKLGRKFLTAFKGPEGAAFLPVAYWFNDEIFLDIVGRGNSFANLRCRPWVEGDVQI